MPHKRSKRIMLLVLLGICLMFSTAILAAAHTTAGDLSIPWWSVDGGGSTSSGGQFSLSGTAGQPDAAISTSGSFSLTSGFWNKRVVTLRGGSSSQIFLPFILRP